MPPLLDHALRPLIVTRAMSLLPSLKPGEMLILDGLPERNPERRNVYKKIGSMAQNLFGVGKTSVTTPQNQTVVVVTRSA